MDSTTPGLSGGAICKKACSMPNTGVWGRGGVRWQVEVWGAKSTTAQAPSTPATAPYFRGHGRVEGEDATSQAGNKQSEPDGVHRSMARLSPHPPESHPLATPTPTMMLIQNKPSTSVSHRRASNPHPEGRPLTCTCGTVLWFASSPFRCGVEGGDQLLAVLGPCSLPALRSLSMRPHRLCVNPTTTTTTSTTFCYCYYT
eukprot:363877-Chlamydomonas_euryale.AAC.3